MILLQRSLQNVYLGFEKLAVFFNFLETHTEICTRLENFLQLLVIFDDKDVGVTILSNIMTSLW